MGSAHERAPRARSSSRARSIFTSPAARSRRRTSSACSPRARRVGDGARVQRHVPALDALGDERPPRRQVRGEPDRRHDRGSSRALETPSMRSASRTCGFECTTGPTVETAMGSSIAPTRCSSKMHAARARRACRSASGAWSPLALASATSPIRAESQVDARTARCRRLQEAGGRLAARPSAPHGECALGRRERARRACGRARGAILQRRAAPGCGGAGPTGEPARRARRARRASG